MAGVALFCVAQEAKLFIYKAINYDWPNTPPFKGLHPYYLVESRVCPEKSDGFKKRLKDHEVFSSDFIGSSEQECQQWLLENQYNPDGGQHLHNFLEQDFLFIADERSARDGTLLVNVYIRHGINFESMGQIPREPYQWHRFRVNYTDAVDIWVHLTQGEPHLVYPTLFLHKDEYVDGNGVLDMSKANGIFRGEIAAPK